MIKRIFDVAGVASFLLLGVGIFLWCGSYRSGGIRYVWRTSSSSVQSNQPMTTQRVIRFGVAAGGVGFNNSSEKRPASSDPRQQRQIENDRLFLQQRQFHKDFESAVAAEQSWFIEHGFELHREAATRHSLAQHSLMIRFPCWVIVVVSAVFAAPYAWWLSRRIVQRRRRSRQLCLACGYDLRSSPDRCPECGAPPAASRSEDAPTLSATDEHVHRSEQASANSLGVVGDKARVAGF
jgi:hypothetical protein